MNISVSFYVVGHGGEPDRVQRALRTAPLQQLFWWTSSIILKSSVYPTSKKSNSSSPRPNFRSTRHRPFPVPHGSPPLPPHLLTSIDRINAALEVALEQPPPATGTLRVCQATEDEWNAFFDSDEHVVRLNYLEWFADTEEIHIIEFADAPHEGYIAEFTQLSSLGDPHVHRWIKNHLAAKNSQGRRCCPDISFGPRQQRTPGSVLPPGVPIFADFRTLRVEIGVSQAWGLAPGQLDHKAISIWAATPGVEYVLCVKFDPDFTNAEYKLYDVQVTPLVQQAPIPIVAPRTVIQLDGRRILGIPSGMTLPVGFPATVSVDLYSPLVWAMR